MKLKFLLLACLSLGPFPVTAGDRAGDRAGSQLVGEARCQYCHSYRDKDRGPSFEKVYQKWNGKPDAMEKLTAFITTPHTVVINKFEGGKEVAHEPFKAWTPEDVKTVVRWMLSPARE